MTKSFLIQILLFGFFLTFTTIFTQAQDYQVRGFDFQVKTMLYAKNIDKIVVFGRPDYFPLFEADGRHGIYFFDPQSGEYELVVSDDINVTGTMKLSPDESLLYIVGTEEDTQIKVYRFPSMDLHRTIDLTLPGDEDGVGSFTWGISAFDPEFIAVIRNGQRTFDRSMILFYQDGNPLPNRSDNHLDLRGFYPQSVLFSDVKNECYVHSSGQLTKVNFDGNGLVGFETSYNILDGSTTVHVNNGKLYGSNGAVVDITDDTPVFLGTTHVNGGQVIGAGAAPTFAQYIEESNSILYMIYLYISEGRIFEKDADQLHLINNISFKTHERERDIDEIRGMTWLDGRNFAYYSHRRLYIENKCSNESPPISLDESFYEPRYLCGNEDTLVIEPPTGQQFIFDQTGRAFETLKIAQAGEYTLRTADDQGCLNQATPPIIVRESFKPIVERISIRGNNFSNDSTATICRGSDAYFKINGDRTDYIYYWSTGASTRNLTVTTPGNYWVQATNEEGCVSDTSHIMVNLLDQDAPPPPSMITNNTYNTNLCELNEDDVSLFAATGYHRYHWSIHPFDLAANSNRISIDEVGYYEVQGMDEAGCWSDFTGIQVLEGSMPFPPVIVRVENFLGVNSFPYGTYRWYLNDEVIPNSNTRTIPISISGSYQVQAYNGICWSNLSEKFIVP